MKLIRGDCLKIMPDIEDGSVDMIMADPPLRNDCLCLGFDYTVRGHVEATQACH